MKSVNEIGFSQENSYHSMKHLKRDFLLLVNKLLELMLYSLNAKEHYQSFIRNKNRTSKIITYQSKPFGNLNIVNIKSVIKNVQVF